MYGNVRQSNVRVLYVRYREKNNVPTVRIRSHLGGQRHISIRAKKVTFYDDKHDRMHPSYTVIVHLLFCNGRSSYT